MATFITRAIQRRHGVERTIEACPECGHKLASTADFPGNNVLGAGGWLWLARRRPPLGLSIRCPRCGAALTMDEDLSRRGRRRRR